MAGVFATIMGAVAVILVPMWQGCQERRADNVTLMGAIGTLEAVAEQRAEAQEKARAVDVKHFKAELTEIKQELGITQRNLADIDLLATQGTAAQTAFISVRLQGISDGLRMVVVNQDSFKDMHDVMLDDLQAMEQGLDYLRPDTTFVVDTLLVPTEAEKKEKWWQVWKKL